MSEQQPSAPTQTLDPREFDLVLVDQSKDAKDAARIEADARLTNELNEGGRFRRFVKSIWKGNIAKDYYRQKYQTQAHNEIVARQDILVHESTSQEHRDSAMYATIQRFQSDYTEMVHTEAGETKHDVDESTEIAQSLKTIIRDYAEGRLDDESLREERARVLQAYREQNGTELAGPGLVQVDNMLEVAQAVKGAVSQGESIDAIIDGMRVISGESRAGVRTAVEFDRVDKVIEKLSGTKLGLVLGSEATIAAATIAASVLRLGSKKAVGAAAMTVAPGVGTSLLAAARERKRVKEDRQQHAREMAQGKLVQEGSSRREEMEGSRYETVAASELIDGLNSYLGEHALDGDDALQAALDQLAAVQTREELSDARSIDLISYSSAVSVEDERFRLALARAQLKVALGSRLDDDAKQRLGIENSATLDEVLTARSEQFISTFEEDIDAKDAAFRKLRNRRVAIAAAQGAVAGLTLGIVSQEIGAALSSTREGLVEQLWSHDTELHNGAVHHTLLEGMAGGTAGTTHTTVLGEHPSFTNDTFGDSKYSLSDNMTVNHSGGSLDITGADGKPIIEGVSLRPDGSLSQKAQDLLGQKGLVVEDLSHKISIEHTDFKSVSVHDFMQNHQADTTHVTRDLWYDNDTPGPVYDKNELGLHWGGGGDGVTKEGSVQFSIATMQADGSYHDTFSTDWAQDAKHDTLKLAISPSGDTQAHPFLVDINPDGTANIDPDSPAAQFFKIEDGHAVFEGKYAEVVQLMGKDDNGVEHIRPLATYVGSDSVETVRDTVHTTTHEMVHEYKITAPPIEVTETNESFTEMAPVIPVVARRSLESLQSPDNSSYYYGYGLTPEQVRRFRQEECSPRLNKDPHSVLNPGQELSWRRQKMTERLGTGYVEQIDKYIDDSPELKDLPADTKAIVTIPVAASSEQDNIYHTLESYAQQDEMLDKTTLLLHMNWFDAPKEGKGISQDEHEENIRKTFAEIERAKHDFPQLRIAIMQTQWERAKEAAGEYGDGIIGHVARRMYDAALMSVERQMRAGKLDSNEDVLLIRNDSDAQGIQRTYLKRMIEAMQAHPENDVFTGAIRWGTERHRDLPGLGVVSNFREIMHVLASRKGVATWPPTVGINTAVRMSTFAAVGSVGDSATRTGIGTDDYNIGGRIKDARQVLPDSSSRRGGYFGYDSRTTSSGSTRTGYGTRGLSTPDNFTYHRHVGGATIDTAPDRLERAYVNDVPIHDAWGDWDNTTRSEGLGADNKDDLRSNEGRDALIQRVERDLSVAISHRFINRKQVMAGLAFVFPDARYYRITPNADRRGVTLQLTQRGRDYLINRLLRDGRGRFDPYGNRVRRALYNEVKAGAKKQPLPSRPVLV